MYRLLFVGLVCLTVFNRLAAEQERETTQDVESFDSQMQDLQKNMTELWTYIFKLRNAVSSQLTHLRGHQLQLIHAVEHLSYHTGHSTQSHGHHQTDTCIHCKKSENHYHDHDDEHHPHGESSSSHESHKSSSHDDHHHEGGDSHRGSEDHHHDDHHHHGGSSHEKHKESSHDDHHEGGDSHHGSEDHHHHGGSSHEKHKESSHDHKVEGSHHVSDDHHSGSSHDHENPQETAHHDNHPHGEDSHKDDHHSGSSHETHKESSHDDDHHHDDQHNDSSHESHKDDLHHDDSKNEHHNHKVDSHHHGGNQDSHRDDHHHEHKDNVPSPDDSQKAQEQVAEKVVATVHRYHHNHGQPQSHHGHNHGHHHDHQSSDNRTVFPGVGEYSQYLFAICSVDRNRAIDSQTQHDLHGEVTFFQRKTGGSLGIHFRVSGFKMDGHHHAQRVNVLDEVDQSSVNNKHGLHVHTSGDMSNGCESMGAHYNPIHVKHGGPNAHERHVGDFGNIECDDHGYSNLLFSDSVASLTGENSILGRGLVIHANEDDYGLNSDDPESLKTGNAGGRIGCCIIKEVSKPSTKAYRYSRRAKQYHN